MGSEIEQPSRKTVTLRERTAQVPEGSGLHQAPFETKLSNCSKTFPR